MKNKKLIILFLVFLILIFPLERVRAFEPFTFAILAGATLLTGAVAWWTGKAVLSWLGNQTGKAIVGIIWFFTEAVHRLLWWINNTLLAQAINAVSILNPFIGPDGTEAGSPVVVLWDILKNFAYIILVFSALAAAYEWLLGDDASAKRLIFNIIIVALIISFTFVLVRESFLIVDSLERGLSGTSNQNNLPNSKVIGTIIAASLWQGDPIEFVTKLSQEIAVNPDNDVVQYLAQSIGYIFILILDFLIFIILIITLVLFVARYVIFTFLAATSSVALASLTFPEFKGALGKTMSEFRFFDTWLDYFIRWLVVIPLFVILVILGNVLKTSILAQVVGFGQTSTTVSFDQFIILFIILIGWYLISIRIAVKLSGAAGSFAKAFATGALLTVGAITAKGIMTATQGTVGGILSKVGGNLQERVGAGGTFGWRSWVGQKIGKPIKETGEKMIERRYGIEAEAVKGRIGSIDEQLRKTTDQGQIQNLTSQMSQLIKQYKGNDHVLKSLNESIKRMHPYSASKIIASSENFEALTGPDVPQETREVIIGLKDKLRKSDWEKIVGDRKWLETVKKASPDVADAYIEEMREKIKEKDALGIISKDDIRDFIGQLGKDDNLRKAFNSMTKGFANALLEKNIENISNAMASWDKDIWIPENTEKINNILKSQLSEDEIKASIVGAIRRTENRSAIIRGALKEDPNGPLRTILGRLTDKERDDLKRLLTSQDQATFEAIHGVIIT
jgi:hypothetical protein